MGNKQSSNRKKLKKEYLKIIANKKREYYKKNKEVIESCDFKVSLT